MTSSPSERDSEKLTRVAVAVVEHKGRYLIGQRPPDVALAGLWEFPGGKIEPHETCEQAAEREAREETGLHVRAVRLIASVIHAYDHGTVEISFVACELANSQVRPKPPFRWVVAQDLAQYEFPAANRSLLAKLSPKNT